MNTYRFTFAIDETLDDLDVVDAFYARVDDASVARGDGKTFVHFDREADSLDQALHTAITELLKEGWHVREISVEPDCVLPIPAP